VENDWPKACACGETWSREQWGELTPVGRYLADEWLELRSCVCGKTLAVPTRELGLVEVPKEGLEPSRT
jgi:hypothetical protein